MAQHTKAIQQMPPQEVEARSHGEAERSRENVTFQPRVDIIDTNDEFLVVADVPGASQETIDVTYQDDVLTIDVPVEHHGVGPVAVLRQEYGVGSFQRRFVVEAPVDADRMSAHYEHGVLTIHLPKAEKAKGRRIKVKQA
ncbi:MAG: Hsp20/alpha crystallin family protein [Phycisphaerales bacterium]|nr:MAG: Hsp20/alpha crystallin family protein [Phycisphaerales bacterium]